MSSQYPPTESSVDGVLKFPQSDDKSKYDKFSNQLVDEFGDDIRLVFVYDQSDFRMEFIQEDLIGDDLLPRITKLYRQVTKDFPLKDSELTDTFGEMQCWAALHEDVAVLCFKEPDEDKGIIATVDYNGGFLTAPN